MASPNQDSQHSPVTRRSQQRRLVLLLAAAFALLAWGPRAVNMLERGWSSSCLALERQKQIDAAEQRIDALQREVAYARTSEGKDVEAKRRFGVGPRDEIWITVEAEKAPEERPQPQSIADRVDAWLANAGSAFVDRIRRLGAIVSYWVGLSDVDRCVAVPVIEDDAPDEAVEDATSTADSGLESAGVDGEAAGDDADTR